MNDLDSSNTIFYDDKLYIIDTSRYSLEEDSSYKLIERKNQKRLNIFFLKILFIDYVDNLTIDKFNNIILKMSPKIKSLYNDSININCYFDKPLDFSIFLISLIDELKCDNLAELHHKILIL